MQLKNIPVETISKCNAAGNIVPMRIRLETQEHKIITADIMNVLYAVENNFAGIKTFDYCCRTFIDEREQLIELRYHVANHKWTIRKILC